MISGPMLSIIPSQAHHQAQVHHGLHRINHFFSIHREKTESDRLHVASLQFPLGKAFIQLDSKLVCCQVLGSDIEHLDVMQYVLLSVESHLDDEGEQMGFSTSRDSIHKIESFGERPIHKPFIHSLFVVAQLKPDPEDIRVDSVMLRKMVCGVRASFFFFGLGDEPEALERF